MASKMKNLLLVFLITILLMISVSQGSSSAGLDGANPSSLFRKDGGGIKTRKLMAFDALLDYDDPCANPKHDPRKKGCKGNP